MEQREPLSEREEARGLLLAKRQPESAQELQELIEKVTSRAIPVVLKDPKVAKRLEGIRFRVVSADLREDKPGEGREKTSRLGEIGIYDYDHNMLVIPVVDLRKGVVVSVEERRGLQPPLTLEEVEEAKKIVLSDPQFRSLKKRSRLEIIAFPARAAFTESHPCYGHRCFVLYFWAGGKQPKRVAEAVVDLSAQQLIPKDAEEPSVTQEERQ
jgi:hypothetical protein